VYSNSSRADIWGFPSITEIAAENLDLRLYSNSSRADIWGFPSITEIAAENLDLRLYSNNSSRYFPPLPKEAQIADNLGFPLHASNSRNSTR
jgi:hypothetical protein